MLCIVARISANRDRLGDFWMHEVSVTALATTIGESGPFKIRYQTFGGMDSSFHLAVAHIGTAERVSHSYT